ncbi:hypothetical protein KSS87_007574 [Heliosperma pusillum]|nr:hypothetical protein KSS87_007574 [Heliosperma pusillum]
MRSSKFDVVLDRLSEMPDQVIVHVLSFMPTRDAVRTMLFRRFGYLWTMLPALSFNFNDHYVRNYNVDDDEDGDEDEEDAYEEQQRIMSEAFSRFAGYVRNVLMLHRRSTIDSFHLDIGEYKSDHVDPCLIDDVQVWLKFATDREVKVLSFACDFLDDIAPPRCIFTCQSIVTLPLYGSMLVQYEHQPQLHMGKLRKLSLIGVHGSETSPSSLQDVIDVSSLQEVYVGQLPRGIHLRTMKPQKRTRSSKFDVGLDRLTEMPDQVIVHILSFMPTRDAVRTMLLHRFGNLWTMLPTLSFDFNDHYVKNYDTDDDEDEDEDQAFEEKQRIMSEAFSRFARFVRNLLMLHRRSTIDSFHFDIGSYKSDHVDPCLIEDVQVWLKFATDREVKDLSFACDYLDDIAPPRCVFTSQSIVTLSLCGRLRDLNVTAPSASRLELDIADVPDRPFTLNCPHVEILNIAVNTLFKNSRSFMRDVIDVSSLQEVYVRHLPICLSGRIIKAFLRHFRDAEFFTFSSQAFEKGNHYINNSIDDVKLEDQVMGICDTLFSSTCVRGSSNVRCNCYLLIQQLCCVKKVDIPQNKWQILALQPWWDNGRCLQVIIELVKSSVELEELIVYAGQSSRSEGYNEVLSSELSTYVMPQLKNVIIHGYGKCCEGQLQLIELILRNAVALEKLEITFEENRLTAVEELDFVKQVSRLKRASVNAIVDFA